jgi:acetyl-CoA carboxylase, biotin carboxylase subunit
MPDAARPIKRVFVANRGEIALRAIRAAHALGLEAVLGVSTADRQSLAAREADRTVVLGPPAARNSYLDIRLIVHAAIATGCDALHPGYGFLSERAELAEMCEAQNIVFIGPTAAAIRMVGDKLSARTLARSVGIPMTSGSDAVSGLQQALKIAGDIGYPVITKASAGGGGRGMLVARSAEDLVAGFDQAVTTAREAFGDGTLFIERYVEVARHIEVQVVGDGRGGIVHFGERDCSIQRRYQKMMEEAPATVLAPDVRTRLHQSAKDLMGSIAYRNAGTVEFLYDEATSDFFFMEVNARIQVEHPVSEEITGHDLVKTQIQLASGTLRTFDQSAVKVRGHAIEARILAEDPTRDFIPCPGRITRWQPPQGPGIRVDSAMETGAQVPPFYDSMIAKLIVRGETREDAVGRLAEAVDNFVVEGIATNIPLLKFIVSHPDYRANRINTRWLETVLLSRFRAAIG